MTKEKISFLVTRISKTTITKYSRVTLCKVRLQLQSGRAAWTNRLHVDKARSRRFECDRPSRTDRWESRAPGSESHRRGPVSPLRERKRTSRKRMEGMRRRGGGGTRSQPSQSAGVDQSLCSTDGATALPQLTSPRADRKV